MPFKSISELEFDLPEGTEGLVSDLILINNSDPSTCELVCSKVGLNVTYIIDSNGFKFKECLSLRGNGTCTHYAGENIPCNLKRNPI